MQETERKKKKKTEFNSKNDVTKISKIPSLLASDTAKGPCKHNRLYFMCWRKYILWKTIVMGVDQHYLAIGTFYRYVYF